MPIESSSAIRKLQCAAGAPADSTAEASRTAVSRQENLPIGLSRYKGRPRNVSRPPLSVRFTYLSILARQRCRDVTVRECTDWSARLRKPGAPLIGQRNCESPFTVAMVSSCRSILRRLALTGPRRRARTSCCASCACTCHACCGNGAQRSSASCAVSRDGSAADDGIVLHRIGDGEEPVIRNSLDPAQVVDDRIGIDHALPIGVFGLSENGCTG